jgi:hypothetical protein
MRFPRHWVSPGEHTPEHVPFTHVCWEHAAALVQVPLALQLCGVLPAHCTWLGAHTPVHVAAMHV